eukprot:7355811-Lingulodinium_polyedra.AAC.1
MFEPRLRANRVRMRTAFACEPRSRAIACGPHSFANAFRNAFACERSSHGNAVRVPTRFACERG